MQTTKRLFSTHTIDCTTWEILASSLQAAVEDQAEAMRNNHPVEFFVESGINMIPLDPKAWRKLANGYEMDSDIKARWFSKYEKAPSGHGFVPSIPKPSDVPHLIEAVIWSTSMVVKYLKKGISSGAIRNTITNALQRCPCSPDIMFCVVTYATRYCIVVLQRLLLSPNGGVNRALEGFLEDMMEDSLTYTRWENKALRLKLIDGLLRKGIGEMESRSEQEAFIAEALRNNFVGEFNKSIHRAIIKYLTTSGYVMRRTKGVRPLAKYTKEELSEKLKVAATKKATYVDPVKKAAEIQRKQRDGIPLTAAERKWKSRHTELFII